MQMRPYQTEAKEAINAEWAAGHKRTLAVMPTGTGKTIVFAGVAEDQVRAGNRVLILAHRGELLEQASDKIRKTTGLCSAVEKADQSCLDSWYRITVGSVQSLQRDKRLNQFAPDYFGSIIIDEAHHAITDGYRRVIDHFPDANVLGVTATPDRGDMRNLGEVFDSLAYEYKLTQAIKDGFLCKIMAQTIPLKLDISQVAMSGGDFAVQGIGTALDPYLDQIAEQMEKVCAGRKTVVFLPLIKTSQKFRDILNAHGFRAAEVNGESDDRREILRDFDAGKYNVLCNSMLLTEGWDCPSVDCIVVLRPTKVRALYSQMVGRGTRLCPETGKKDLLILDFLWLTERHELCRPADLICEDHAVSQKMTDNLAAAGCPEDIEQAVQSASEDVVLQREEALAKQLSEMRKRKAKLVDPLQYEMSIQAEDLTGYVPSFGWECEPATPKQQETLEKLGILPDSVDNAGKAKMLLDRLDKRRQEGLTTPKQIRFLEGRGFQHVGTWPFEAATKMITRISASGWHIPNGIVPSEYKP
ncbi:MAG: DEAD/DEAH box helicase [Clostridiales bacterium]|nr:DEAD/DEAH box helicase [Clostridiales bacterium]